MPTYGYDHIHLVSLNPLETAQFYEEMFDARRVTETKLPDGRNSVSLDLNGSRILIIEGKPPAAGDSSVAGGIDHFGILTDDLETAVAGLKAKGVKFRDEIRVLDSGIKISFLWAPDNVLIELMERV